MADLDPIALNVRGVSTLVNSKTNKVNTGVFENEEGVEGELEDALTLKMEDAELLRLAREREALYAPYESKIVAKQRKNKEYYLGQQKQGQGFASDESIAGNLLFEAEETFLPAALSKNPEPVVYSDNSEEGNKLSQDVKTMLQYHADQLVLRRKLHQMTRQWSIYLLGVLKHGWDEDIKDIRTDLRKIQDFIFDPDGFVDVYGDFNGWLGERITVTASKLAEMFPDHKAYIEDMVESKMGTSVTYTEWWEDELTYCTFKEVILDKSKNPNFKYEGEDTDEFGNPITVPAVNHFAKPKKPYTFLSVFSLGEQPHDITSLIEQNIPNQNLVTRRIYQIDLNLSKANNSDLFSEDNFNQQTGKQAANARMKGNPILVPPGRPIQEAMTTLPVNSIPDAFFKELEGNKEALRTSFGTQGITAQQPNEDTTARGMILNQQYDNTRIGGGIGEAIEQVADNIFNWWVQLYHVYYDEPHFAAVLGQTKAVEYVTLTAQDLNRRLIVSVAPDSMKPKDELTQMNQAMELYDKQAIGPKTLLTMLDFPDPQASAEDGVLWQVDKNAYIQLNFPDLAQKLAQLQAQVQQAQGAPQGAPTPPAPPQGAPSLGGENPSASLSQVPLPQ